MKKRKFISISVFLLAIVVVAFMWGDKLLLHIAPKAVLTSSLTKIFTQLENRFRNDPIWILARSIDPEDRYTADIQMETENTLLGRINYDVMLQWYAADHRISAEGSCSTEEKEMDLSVYMDSDVMAVSSNGLLNGNYYGVRYDTFAEDIRSIPLLRFIVSEKQLSKWEASIKEVQAKMNRDITLPKVPEISSKDIKMLLLGIIAAPCEIDNVSFEQENETIDCQKLTYSTAAEELQDVLSKMMQSNFTDASVTVSFYLYQKSVIRISILYQLNGQILQFSLDLGEDPERNQLFIQGSRTEGNTETFFAVEIDTLQSEIIYSEHWDIQVITDGDTKHTALKYNWNPSSGEMTLNINDSSKQVEMIFQERDNGFYLSTNTFGWLLEEIMQESTVPVVNKDTLCAMTVSRGATIATPQFKNINQWSMEDFIVLVGGIGSLFGINLNGS